MWVFHRMLKIPWTTRLKNYDVPKNEDADRVLLEIVEARKIKYFGHVIRADRFELLR